MDFCITRQRPRNLYDLKVHLDGLRIPNRNSKGPLVGFLVFFPLSSHRLSLTNRLRTSRKGG